MTDETIARVAALLTEFGTSRRRQLFEAGYEGWRVDGDVRPDALIETVEDVGLCALTGDDDNPESLVDIVDRVDTLAVATGLAGTCFCSLDRFEDTRRSLIQPWGVLKQQYAETMAALTLDSDRWDLKREIGEVLFRKPPAEHVQSHGGPVVTDIVHGPVGNDGQYLEIPLTAASSDCLVGFPESDAPVAEQPDGAPDTSSNRTLLRDNCLLIPSEELTRRYRSYLTEQAFPSLQETLLESLTDEQRTWLLESATAISDAVDNLVEQGHRERLWTHVHAGDGLVTALEESLTAATGDDAPALGDPASVEALYQTLVDHTPEEPWVQSTINNIRSVHALRRQLSRYADHPRLKPQEREHTRLWVVKPSPSGGEAISIDHPVDFLQLPCYQNLDERLQEKGPTRKELWDLVRKTAWLPQYRSNGSPDVERILADIKELFSRWPWYDPRITEQQVRYELRPDAARRRLDGNEPLPMGCDNPDMQQYCIGKDECPYSIYGSIPFAESLYETLEDSNESDN